MNNQSAPPKPKKRKITISLDEDIVQYFQLLGHKEDRPYQPLMNKVLRAYVEKEIQNASHN